MSNFSVGYQRHSRFYTQSVCMIKHNSIEWRANFLLYLPFIVHKVPYNLIFCK